MIIAKRKIGPGHPPYIVAEIGSNHGGNFIRGCRTIDAAKEAGADAVKLQCYTAETICAKAGVKLEGNIWAGKNLYELYKEAETPPKLIKDLYHYALKVRIPLFASVFSFEDADYCGAIGLPAFKIASFELVDTPLIQHCAAKGLPVIISTGMGTRQEILDAINAYHKGNCGSQANLGMLHCVSSYPASPQEANLAQIGPLSELARRDHVVGFSDHTLGVGTAAAAVAFGASIIEKHFILDRGLGGPDSSFSLEPVEFRALTTACREAWEAIQPRPEKDRYPNRAYRKSLWVVRDVSSGDSFSTENCRILRPAGGLSPSKYASVLGAVASCDLKAGTPLTEEMVSFSD